MQKDFSPPVRRRRRRRIRRSDKSRVVWNKFSSRPRLKASWVNSVRSSSRASFFFNDGGRSRACASTPPAAPPALRGSNQSIPACTSSRAIRSRLSATFMRNQSPRTPKRRLTGAAVRVVTPLEVFRAGPNALAPPARRDHARVASRTSQDAASPDPSAARRAGKIPSSPRRPGSRARRSREPGRRGMRRTRSTRARDDHRASTHHYAERATHRATGDQRRDRGWVTRVLSRDVRVHHAQGSHGRGGRRTRSTRGERGAMRRDGMTRVLGGASSRGTTCARPAGVGVEHARGGRMRRARGRRARGGCVLCSSAVILDVSSVTGDASARVRSVDG